MPKWLTIVLVIAVLPGRLCAQGQAFTGQKGMVVCVSPDAADIGIAIQKKGGNAVDSAIAVAFAMAVTHPGAGNIGGGGFMLIRTPKGEAIMIDYRETAPGSVTEKTFEQTTDWHNHQGVGVPGTVRGLERAHRRYGTLPWKDLLQPAIRLAQDGFTLNAFEANSLNTYLKKPGGNDEFRRVFGKNNGKDPWAAGDKLKQPDLAKTLTKIADAGADAFYQGELAELLVAEMKAGKGFITLADLNEYRAIERLPVKGNYRGHEILSASPPSGGGTCLIEMLNLVERFDLKKWGPNDARTKNVLAEAMKRGYADRAQYLGDPGYTKIPNFLTDKQYARKLAEGIDPGKMTPSSQLGKDIPIADEKDSTTHFSVIDANGLCVSNTYTLEDTFGSRVVVKGAGYILNNEMGDFNSRPGYTNTKGKIGTSANLVAPGKRMLSSQTPTIVVKNGKPLLITGSPGGRTITNTVFCIITNVIDFEMPIQDAVDAPRMHHQWYPDALRVEDAQAPWVDELKKMGYKITQSKQGDGHSIWIDPKTSTYHGAQDRRLAGKASGY